MHRLGWMCQVCAVRKLLLTRLVTPLLTWNLRTTKGKSKVTEVAQISSLDTHGFHLFLDFLEFGDPQVLGAPLHLLGPAPHISSTQGASATWKSPARKLHHSVAWPREPVDHEPMFGHLMGYMVCIYIIIYIFITINNRDLLGFNGDTMGISPDITINNREIFIGFNGWYTKNHCDLGVSESGGTPNLWYLWENHQQPSNCTPFSKDPSTPRSYFHGTLSSDHKKGSGGDWMYGTQCFPGTCAHDASKRSLLNGFSLLRQHSNLQGCFRLSFVNI